ncbi:hypothetical protein [Pseudorhodoplanes sp.]|uniref:hypothetical protein n=1 Tax=Pseudorhodoplanes sp. TaxID=1934341 RepID=UPI00391BBC59
MKRVFVLAAFGAVLAALPAKAQPFAADLLPAYEVNTIVASMGMRPVGRPAWMRGRYVVAAIDRYGRDVNVVLDARDGHVLAVQPVGRGRFGPPPRGYAEPRYAPPYPVPPAAIPGGPPIDDDGEFFDHDRQQGAMPPRRATARTAPAPRDPAITGSVTRSVPATRREAAPLPRDVTPVPRPRPALARANDPGTRPAEASAGQPPATAKTDQTQPDAASKPAGVEAKAEATLEPAKPQAKKPEGKPQSRQVSVPQAAKPGQAKPETEGNPESRKPVAANPDTSKPGASKPEASSESAAPKSATSKPEIRVIDLGKPETAPKPDDKPGVAIRF